ncbi:MAG: hypothetical protein H6621_01810 [Halobacteriovoraceae bacterium]|nr:hypothetical protein [Halobacteriovoraceae bacterium]MCB9093777.1 hypothetical protein [Halobacteriovoraceae bacterium]
MKKLVLITVMIFANVLHAAETLELKCYNFEEEEAMEMESKEDFMKLLDRDHYIGSLSLADEILTVEMNEGVNVGDIENGDYEVNDAGFGISFGLNSGERAVIMWFEDDPVTAHLQIPGRDESIQTICMERE